jgi:pyrimidine deaminase RibD-like protein
VSPWCRRDVAVESQLLREVDSTSARSLLLFAMEPCTEKASTPTKSTLGILRASTILEIILPFPGGQP